MTKKNVALISIVIVLLGVYLVFFSGLFKREPIAISHTSRPARSARPVGQAGDAVLPITFTFEKDYEFNEVSVVVLAVWQTNNAVPPVWHLVSDSASATVNHFFYGEEIDGMDSVLPGAKVEPLQPLASLTGFLSGPEKFAASTILNPDLLVIERRPIGHAFTVKDGRRRAKITPQIAKFLLRMPGLHGHTRETSSKRSSSELL